MKTVLPIQGVFDLEQSRLVGIIPTGVSDVTYLAGQDTQTDGTPVTAKTDPLNGGIEFLVGGEVIDVGGSPVSITGTFEVGETLTAELADGWTAGGYQWTREGTDISGAVSANYTLGAADLGKVVSCKVSGLVYGPTGQTVGGVIVVEPFVIPSRVIPIGDSITASTSTGSWVDPAVLDSCGRIVMVRNAGIGGNTTQQMIDRFATDVAAYASDEIWIQAGTNDVGTLTDAQFAAKLGTLIDLAVATGRIIRVGNIPPKDTNIAAALSFRANVIPTVCAEKGVHCFDLWADTIDPSDGGFYSTDTVDGVHPSNAGFLKAKTKLLDELGVATSTYLSLATTNDAAGGMLANRLFQTDTNADGVADLWTTGGSATFAKSLVPSDYGNKQQIACVAQSSDMYLQTSPPLTVVAGNKYKLKCKIAVIGENMIWALRIRWQTAASVDVSSSYPLNCIVDASGEFEGDFVAPATAARLNIQLRVYNQSGKQVTATASIERCSVQNLGAA